MGARQAQAEEAAAALLRGVNAPAVLGNTSATAKVGTLGLRLLMLQWLVLQCLPCKLGGKGAGGAAWTMVFPCDVLPCQDKQGSACWWKMLNSSSAASGATHAPCGLTLPPRPGSSPGLSRPRIRQPVTMNASYFLKLRHMPTGMPPLSFTCPMDTNPGGLHLPEEDEIASSHGDVTSDGVMQNLFGRQVASDPPIMPGRGLHSLFTDLLCTCPGTS